MHYAVQEYAKLPSFCKSQLDRDQLNGALSAVERLAEPISGGRTDGSFSLQVTSSGMGYVSSPDLLVRLM